MGLDAGLLQLLKEVDGHLQVDPAHALDGEAHGILTGVELAVLAGAVVFELQQVVAVFQGVNILGLSRIYQFHFQNSPVSFSV